MIDRLMFLDAIDLGQVLVVVLVAALMAAVLVIIVGLRRRSDIRAAAVTQAQRPRRPLPQNFGSGWDRVDEYRRPY